LTANRYPRGFPPARQELAIARTLADDVARNL
jgi:hypothetical protein